MATKGVEASKREPDRPVQGRAIGNFPFRETPAEVGSRALTAESMLASSQAKLDAGNSK